MKVQVKDEQGIDEAGNKHPAPGIDDGTYECELKWEMRTNKDLVDAGIDKEIKWVEVSPFIAEDFSVETPQAFRRKWVLAEQEKEDIEQLAGNYADSHFWGDTDKYDIAKDSFIEGAYCQSTRIAELSARVAELEGVLEEICNLNWEEGSDLQIVTKMYDLATNALKNQQP